MGIYKIDKSNVCAVAKLMSTIKPDSNILWQAAEFSMEHGTVIVYDF